MSRPPNLLRPENLTSYTADLKGSIVYDREFRAPLFPMLRNLLTNPLEELVCLTNPNHFVRLGPVSPFSAHPAAAAGACRGREAWGHSGAVRRTLPRVPGRRG